MRPRLRFTRLAAGVAAAALVMLTSGVDASGQNIQGEVVRAHWPDVLYETQAGAMDRPSAAAAEDFADTEVLPFVDTLALGYEAQVVNGHPTIDFRLRWRAGNGGILDGRLVQEMPDSLLLTMIDLHAEVRIGGQAAGDLVLSLDSLDLPPGDFHYVFSTAADWESVFEGMDAEASQAAFESGFVLEGLDILRVEFEAPPPPAVEREVLVVRRPPRRRTIFLPDVNIWIGWDLGRDPYRGSPRIPGGNRRPRGETIGRNDGDSDDGRTRGGRAETTDSGGERSGDDRGAGRVAETGDSGSDRGKGRSLPLPKGSNDDDDDDRDFLGPALGAAAAVGALAYFGGTIGYFGYPSEAPVGIEAGRITERGGVLIHAAMNMNVFEGGQEQMVVGLSGAFRPLAGYLHPVAGVDIWFREDGDSFDAVPVVTAGGLLRTGNVALQMGLDLSSRKPRVGVAFSFR